MLLLFAFYYLLGYDKAMKIILIKDVARLGQRGSIIDVADSFALNVLIPKGQATIGTNAELAKWKQKEDSKKFKKDLETNTFSQLINKIRNEKIIITDKKHEGGNLFAQIKESDIANAIYKTTKLSIDPKQIIIEKIIKTTGNHKVIIKQGDQSEKVEIEIK